MGLQKLTQSPWEYGLYEGLRRNPPEVWVTGGQNLVPKLFTLYCKLLCDCFKYRLKKKSFLATPNVENECWTLYETLESTGEMKLMMKFTYVCTISLNFEIYFLSFPWRIVFGVISGNYLYLKLLENAKRTVICLQTFWNKVFVQ